MKILKLIFLFFLAFFLNSCLADIISVFSKYKFDKDFDKMEIEGRNVYFLKKDGDNERLKKTLESLKVTFKDMDQYFLKEDEKIKWSKTIKYFIESDFNLLEKAGKEVANNYVAWYNNDHDWLTKNSFIPEKRDSICLNLKWYLGNIAVSELNLIQGASATYLRERAFGVLVHETVHAYHFQKIGIEAKDIIDAYEHSKSKGYSIGNNEVNAREYFAEVTQLYFTKNFATAALKQDGRNYFNVEKKEPEGFNLLKKYWSVN